MRIADEYCIVIEKFKKSSAKTKVNTVICTKYDNMGNNIDTLLILVIIHPLLFYQAHRMEQRGKGKTKEKIMGPGPLIAIDVILLYCTLGPLVLFAIYIFFESLVNKDGLKDLKHRAIDSKDPSLWTPEDIEVYKKQA